MALPALPDHIEHLNPLVDGLIVVSDLLNPYHKAISFLNLTSNNNIQHTTRAYHLLEAAIKTSASNTFNPDAYYQLGRILESGIRSNDDQFNSNATTIRGAPVEKDRGRAIALYKTASAYPPALYRLALLSAEDGNESYAKTLLITAISKQPTGDSLCMLADLMMKPHNNNPYYDTSINYGSNNVPLNGYTYSHDAYGHAYGHNNSHNMYNNISNSNHTSDPYRAMKYYMRAAEEFGHPRATAFVCEAIIQGSFGLLSDPHRAVQIYARTVREHKCVPSIVALARIFLHGTYGIRPQPSRAIKFYMRAVSFGDCVAAVELADAFRRRTAGVPIDCVRAFHLYENVLQQAAAAASSVNDTVDLDIVVHAKFSLAYMLITGMANVKEDPNAAGKLFLEAVAAGGRWEDWWTTEFTTDTWETVIFQTTRANLLLDTATAIVTDTEIMRTLADLLLVGKGLVTADPRKAGELYIRAINEESDTRSMRAVADILLTDMFDLKSSVSEALKIYSRAADSGDVHSMRDLAHVLHQGLHGVPPDRKKAIALWDKAALTHILTLRAIRDAGETQLATEKYTAAIENIERDSYTTSTSTTSTTTNVRRMHGDLGNLIRKSDPIKAAECFRKAGGDEAWTNLAELLLFGEIERDPDEALRLCEKAALRNHRARCMVAYLLEKKANSPRNSNNNNTRSNQVRKARKALKRAVDRDGRPFVHAFLRNLKDKDEAAENRERQKKRNNNIKKTGMKEEKEKETNNNNSTGENKGGRSNNNYSNNNNVIVTRNEERKRNEGNTNNNNNLEASLKRLQIRDDNNNGTSKNRRQHQKKNNNNDKNNDNNVLDGNNNNNSSTTT